jgi:hypothetical protein
VPAKPGTDVLLLGTAHPPAGREVTQVDVTLRVAAAGAPIERTLRVHGPRVFFRGQLGIAAGPAARLSPTPLQWDRTWGGYVPDTGACDWRNPAGLGLARDPGSLLGSAAPVIEDPSDARAPACFAPVASWWSPRRELAGNHDDAWRRERAPVRPVDFDVRHYSCAPKGQWRNDPLTGDEPVEVLGATPEGAWRFELPRYAPRFCVAEQPSELDTHLDTMLIDADARTVELSWRAWVRAPRKLERLGGIEVVASDRLPAEVITPRDPASITA